MQQNNRFDIAVDKEGFVRLIEVERVTRLSESTIRRRIRAGTFPPSYPGLTRIKWKLEDIETYMNWSPAPTWNPWCPPI